MQWPCRCRVRSGAHGPATRIRRNPGRDSYLPCRLRRTRPGRPGARGRRWPAIRGTATIRRAELPRVDPESEVRMGWGFLIVLLVLVAVPVLWGIGAYNKLVEHRNRFKNAFSQI